MSTNELQVKAREIKELMRMKEELEAEISSLQDEIKEEMTTQATGEYKIRWTKVTSNRFDTTSFKKTHAELYGQYCNSTESRRFNIA